MTGFLFLATDEGLVLARQDGPDREVWRETGRAGRATDDERVGHQGLVLAGTRDGIWRSADLGNTWQEAGQGLTSRSCALAGPDIPACMTSVCRHRTGGVFVSHDGAASWRPCPEVSALRDRHHWSLPYSPEAGCVRGFAFHGARGLCSRRGGGGAALGRRRRDLAPGRRQRRAAIVQRAARAAGRCRRSLDRSPSLARPTWSTRPPATVFTARPMAVGPGRACTAAIAAPPGPTRPTPGISSSARRMASTGTAASRNRTTAARRGRPHRPAWPCPGATTWSSGSFRPAMRCWRCFRTARSGVAPLVTLSWQRMLPDVGGVTAAAWLSA